MPCQGETTNHHRAIGSSEAWPPRQPTPGHRDPWRPARRDQSGARRGQFLLRVCVCVCVRAPGA
eukprot:4611324-Pyramimonas_sp.AAC.1